MDIENIIQNIIRIPRDYYQQNRSKLTLVQESGYFDQYDQITEELIFEALQKEPEYVDEWIQWSDDQRVSEGWYIKIENGENFVARFSTKGEYRESITKYPDIKTACAAFIKHQIEYSREIAISDEMKRKKRK